MSTENSKRTIVVLDDHESWLLALRREFSRIPGMGSLEVMYCSSDEEARAFVAEHPDRIVGYIQDLGRGNESRPWNLAGMRFFEEVVDRYTPLARTVVLSGAITYERLRKLLEDRPDRVNFISKHMFEADIFADRVQWLLSGNLLVGQLEREPAEPQVQLLLLPWREIDLRIAADPGQIDLLSPRRFEEFVAHIFEEYGWDVELTARTRDGGHDIIAVRKALPTDLRVLIEAKRWRPDQKIGVGLVRALYGIKAVNAASQVVLATTSYVSENAKREYARVIPWELDFLERDKILDWCRGRAGVLVAGDLGSTLEEGLPHHGKVAEPSAAQDG